MPVPSEITSLKYDIEELSVELELLRESSSTEEKDKKDATLDGSFDADDKKEINATHIEAAADGSIPPSSLIAPEALQQSLQASRNKVEILSKQVLDLQIELNNTKNELDKTKVAASVDNWTSSSYSSMDSLQRKNWFLFPVVKM